MLSQNEQISAEYFPDEIKYYQKLSQDNSLLYKPSDTSGLKEASIEAEKTIILNALMEVNHNKTKAAQLLGIDRKTLYNKLKLYNIDVKN